MKKFLLSFLIMFISALGAMAQESVSSSEIINDIAVQKQISDIGFKILNSNKIELRMIFVYNSKNDLVKLEPGLTKRQIVVYDKNLKFASDDAEIAAFLAREICKSSESYHGVFKGMLTSVQIKCAPKKYEIFFDKLAVDLMVNAGYNPIALIIYMNKAYPQKRYDKIARANLTSKRLANVYEYIYTKYPYFLKNNEYLENEAYQNFLLTSIENRKKLAEKIKSGSKKAVNYE